MANNDMNWFWNMLSIISMIIGGLLGHLVSDSSNGRLIGAIIGFALPYLVRSCCFRVKTEALSDPEA